MSDMVRGNCSHDVWAADAKVWLCNDDDSYYVQEFGSRGDVEAFIERVRRAANEAFGTGESDA